MLAGFHYVVLGVSLLVSQRSQTNLAMLKQEMEQRGSNPNDDRRQSVATENAWDKHPHHGRSWSIYSRPDFPVEPYRSGHNYMYIFSIGSLSIFYIREHTPESRLGTS